MKPEYLTLDDVDSRRQLHGLIHRLPPRERVAFLKWACTQVPKDGKGHLPEPAVWKMRATLEQSHRCDRADLALTNEVYGDLLTLAVNFQLDLVKCALALEQLVRRLRV
jgi:hypothetical protein